MNINYCSYLTDDYLIKNTSLKDTIEKIQNNAKEIISNVVASKGKKWGFNQIRDCIEEQGFHTNTFSVEKHLSSSCYLTLPYVFEGLDRPYYLEQSIGITERLNETNTQFNRFLMRYGIRSSCSYFENIRNEKNVNLVVNVTYTNYDGEKKTREAIFSFNAIDEILIKLYFVRFADEPLAVYL